MRNYFFLAAFIAALSSCHYFGGELVSGNGQIITQPRNTASFNSVDVGGSIIVHIQQAATSSVKIETDENLMDYIDVFIDGNTLVIEEKDGYNLNPSKDVIVYVAAPVFKAVEASGACEIIGDGIITGSEVLQIHSSGSVMIKMDVNLPGLVTDVSGSGEVILKGAAKDFTGNISGTGSIKAFDLVTDVTRLDLSGAANASVWVNQKLDVKVSGSADVEYKGNASVSQNISGAGSVKKVS